MVAVAPLAEDERDWLREALTEAWGTTLVVSRGVPLDALELAALVARVEGERAGFATYAIRGDECEVVTLNSLLERGSGVGRALLDAVRAHAERAGCRRLLIVTSNDNLYALRVYQLYGFDLCALHRGAMDEIRRLHKPFIPELGMDGIPLRHELELELALQPATRSARV